MELVDGVYKIGGVKAVDLAAQFGTPLYVYDLEKMKNQYEKLERAFQGTKVSFKYACKALTNLNILKYFKDLGTGLDTVSIGEVQLGLQVGFNPKDIIYTPNSVSMSEIKEVVDLGVHINIDNISILEQFGHEYADSVPVCIRINPHIMAGEHSHISTGHIDSKFGISIHQMRHVERVIQTNNMKVIGLHIHTGSDILDIEVFLRAAEILFETAAMFKGLEYLDFGSGFKVGYKEDDVTTDLQELGQRLSKRFSEFCKEYGKELELWFEPGKFLVSEAGYFLSSVNVVKQTTATVFAGVDSGFNHLIRPMFYDAYHHIVNVSNPKGTPRIYTVVGYICESDTFAWDRKIGEIKEGDVLVFHNAGAYGFSMSSNYNSRFRPAEVAVHDNEAHLIRKRESLDDLTKNLVMAEFEVLT